LIIIPFEFLELQSVSSKFNRINLCRNQVVEKKLGENEKYEYSAELYHTCVIFEIKLVCKTIGKIIQLLLNPIIYVANKAFCFQSHSGKYLFVVQ